MRVRAAIAARYSSDRQSETSIEDQVRLCRRLCGEKGWEVVEVYADYAISGAHEHRPQYQAMLADMRAGTLEIIVAEDMARLSRDQAGMATLYKEAQFARVKIVTLAEGEISELHVGLKGTMNALFLKDLAQKTHRGVEGRVRKGKSGGGRAYGYRKVMHRDGNGEEIRGDLEIVPEEAEVVRRIFRESAAGRSPLAIARGLNADGIPGPRGKGWSGTTIRGHATRDTGILRNWLYVGRSVWNKQQYLRHPNTGKRIARVREQGERIEVDVPMLRIVPQPDWDGVQRRLDAVRASAGSQKMQKHQFWKQRRPRHLFSGLIFCGACGGTMEALGKDYLGCRAAKSGAGCDERRTVRRNRVEDAVLNALRERLMSPEAVEAFTRSLTVEVNRQQTSIVAAKAGAEAELAKVQKKLSKLIDAIAEGFRSEGLQQQLDDLETRKKQLREQIAATPPPQPRLHPRLAEVYRDTVRDLHAALANAATRGQAAETLRRLVDRIAVHHVGKEHMVELTGRILSLLTLPGGSVPDPYESSVKVVAGAGFEPTTFRL